MKEGIFSYEKSEYAIDKGAIIHTIDA
jgi:hypothetical protein